MDGKRFALTAALLAAACFALAGTTGCTPSASTAGPPAAADRMPESAATAAPSPSDLPRDAASGNAMAALDRAARSGRYLFAFFWKTADDQTLAMRKVFEAAVEKVKDRADSVSVNVEDAAQKAIVDKYDLSRVPLPLVLAIAPNGAITGGFPTQFEEKDLLEAFATRCTEKCMKALQDGKLVFLCVQNHATKSNEEALKGVKDFQADERFASATEIVMLDPTEPAEASFLRDLKIDPKTSVAMTAFLVPPGAAIADFEGPTQKDQLVAALENAASNPCAGGSCGPGGCGPR